MANIYIYQIYYDDASKAALDPGFIPLDNSSNERPDWFEYHPIRMFLSKNSLEVDAYYGFFSPRFWIKTNLSAEKVKSFITANEGVDVVLFSPSFEQSAFYLSVFEQGEIAHPGLAQAGQAFVDAVGIDVNIKDLITDSTNTVFANYFVARSKFWARWFELAEQLYAQAEAKRESNYLVAATRHDKSIGPQFKVFLMERLATLLLSTDENYKTAAFQSTELPMHAPFVPYASQAVVCDSLKLAYGRLKNQRYLDEFFALRGAVFQSLRRGPGTVRDR
jgi:hypothetical protein